MSQETTVKISLSLLCIGIANVSVFGLIVGILWLVLSGDYGWLALIIGSALLFIGAVYSIFKFTSSKRALKAEREKKSLRNTRIWVVVAFGSGTGAVLAYFLVMLIIPYFWLSLTIVALLATLCLYSIFVIIFGGRRREEKITNLISPTDDETNKSNEETKKIIEQND